MIQWNVKEKREGGWFVVLGLTESRGGGIAVVARDFLLSVEDARRLGMALVNSSHALELEQRP